MKTEAGTGSESRAFASPMSRRRDRTRAVVPDLTILVASALAYVPLMSRTLYFSDSVGFAFGLHEFNLRLRQPHGLGYPLYIFAARAIQALTGASDNTSLVIVALAATILADWLFY